MQKAKEGVYYLILNDKHFKRIDKNIIINREVYTSLKQVIKPSDIIKYTTFTVNEKDNIKEIYQLIQTLKKDKNILVLLYNPKNKECTFIFSSNKKKGGRI